MPIPQTYHGRRAASVENDDLRVTVLEEGGHIAEVQATAEGATYDEEGLLRLLRLARIGCDRIFAAQAKAAGQ